MITVRVPGTTANLGPGFDCLGCALSVYGEFSFEERPEGLSFENVEAQYQNEENLAVKAYRRAMREMGQKDGGLYLKIVSDIPDSRGLGSSASLIVAGVYAANELHGGQLSRQKMLELVTELEGHPDNVAPALLGGLTASMMCADRVVTMECRASQRLRFCALIPDFELSTKLARQALPAQVSHKDAVFNVSRAVVMVKALENGDLDAIASAMDDRLHQPYRTGLIDEYDAVREAAFECGAASVCISGAGPTILCVLRADDFEERMNRAVRSLRNHWRVLPLRVDYSGAIVIGKDAT